MSLFFVGLLFLVAARAVAGAPGASLVRRYIINHDAVVGYPQTVPKTPIGQLYLKYKPWLKVGNGCVPFPAVDIYGNTGGGLKPTGSPEGYCSSSTGQVYARSMSYNSVFAIMYAWYCPKDEPSPGIGHKHDWENIVVWINSETAAHPTILGVSASTHGVYDTTRNPPLQGTRPLIRYESFVLDHVLSFTNKVGGEQPLVAWESMSDFSRQGLSETDFGKANVPFIDLNFTNNLKKAELL